MWVYLHSLLHSEPRNSYIGQVYRRWYESRRSSQPMQTALKTKQKKYGEKPLSIWRMEFSHPAMWHVALESRQWIHQVAAPCNVISGSRITCHWIRPNIRHIRILHLVSISIISPQSTCHSAPVCVILSKSPSAEKNDVMSIFKMADQSHLGFLGSNNGFFEKLMYDFL